VITAVTKTVCRTTSCGILSATGVAVRDRSEIAALHGSDGHLEAVTPTSGERVPFSFLFLLESSVPVIFAAGDVCSGSTKRCATAVGEGAMAVQFVHAHLAARPR
jgi:NADPH-dependent glutamate synthase beta subunit-like oxidoreductase